MNSFRNRILLFFLCSFLGVTLLLFLSSCGTASRAERPVAEPSPKSSILPSLTLRAATHYALWDTLSRAASEGRASEVLEGLLQQKLRFPALVMPFEQPFLPMIFFDSGSSQIAERYDQFISPDRTESYQESDTVNSEELMFASSSTPAFAFKYYQILNVVGSRMRENPSIVIKLQGGFVEPGETSLLGLERARSIRHYLHAIWNIDTGRMTILPALLLAEGGDLPMIREEGRRVMILSSDPLLTRPVHYSGMMTRNFHVIFSFAIDPNVESEKVKSILLRVSQDDRILGQTSIPVSPDSVHYQMNAYWYYFPLLQNGSSPLIVEAVVETLSGDQGISNQVAIPLEPFNLFDRDENAGLMHPDSMVPDDEVFNPGIQVMVAGYEALSSSPPAWEEQVLESVLDRIDSLVQKFGTGIEITINGSGDVTDVIDQSLFDASIRETPRSISGRYSLTDLLKRDTTAIDLQLFNATLLSDSASFRRLFNTVFKTASPAISTLQTKRYPEREKTVQLTREAGASLESVIRDRQQVIALMLRERFRASEVSIDPILSHPHFLTLSARPEERFFERSVTLFITPPSNGGIELKVMRDEDAYNKFIEEVELRLREKEQKQE